MQKQDSLRILFIRHAHTDYEDYGDRDLCDGDLTAKGEQQCTHLGEKLKDRSIDAFITSPLLRSFKTAAGVCAARPENPLLEICPELVECGCTPGYYGCSEEYLQQHYNNTRMCKKLFGTDEYDFGCEEFNDNVVRVERVISYIKERYSFGDTIAIFSHHGFLEYLIPTALGVAPHVFRFSLDNTSVSAVEFFPDGNTVLRSVNN